MPSEGSGDQAEEPTVADLLRTVEQLEGALLRRATISQAVGILMERFDLTSEAAFDLLVGQSRRSRRKLFDLAAELSATFQPPEP